MGKSVPKLIKRRAFQLLELFPDKFSADFEKNKEFIKSLHLPISKKQRNIIAGFITRYLKKKKEEQ